MGAQENKRKKRIRQNVIDRDGLICCYCLTKLTLKTATMEHIVPASKRGTFNATNLTVACARCNCKRSDKPFFEFCKQYNFSEQKLLKYKKMYFNNLKIKILNVAKEECISNDEEIPIDIIKKACNVLKIKQIDFSDYEKSNNFEISFNSLSDRKKIKFCFENLIKIIESELCDIL